MVIMIGRAWKIGPNYFLSPLYQGKNSSQRLVELINVPTNPENIEARIWIQETNIYTESNLISHDINTGSKLQFYGDDFKFIQVNN